MRIDEPMRQPPTGFALWQLGFRPFYLLASIYAALSVPLWVAQFSGWIGRPHLPGALWHAHEMLFGFALAVVVGFLLTAAQTWTGRPTLRGAPLQALVLLWIAARVLVLTPYGWAAALVNIAFAIAAAAALAVPLLAARNHRNYVFAGALFVLACAAGAIHLASLQVVEVPAWLGIELGLDVILFVMAVMGGRVIPMFTNNAIRGAAARRDPWVERGALGSVLLLMLAGVAGISGTALATLAMAAALLHVVRLALWQPWKTLGNPLVWVLHLAYLWIPLHLALRAAAAVDWIAPTIAVHALTVGAIGGLTIGMMTRTARGHTGRLLQADRWEVACYLLVFGAACLRLAGGLWFPERYLQAVQWSGAFWAVGFGLYAVRYWPVLSRPRIDGRPG